LSWRLATSIVAGLEQETIGHPADVLRHRLRMAGLALGTVFLVFGLVEIVRLPTH
jgi:hypothetical protein